MFGERECVEFIIVGLGKVNISRKQWRKKSYIVVHGRKKFFVN